MIQPPVQVRQETESRKAFRAYQTYRDMGDSRTLRKTAELLHLKPSLISSWSQEFGWSARLEEWSDYLARTKLEKQATQVIEMHERHASVACMFQTKVIERLMQLTPADLALLSPDTLMSWFSQAARIEAQARGVPSHTIAASLSSPDGGPIKVEFVETIVRTREEVEATRVANVLPMLTDATG